MGTGALCIHTAREWLGCAARDRARPSKHGRDNDEEEDPSDATRRVSAARGNRDPLYKSTGPEQFLSAREVEQYPLLRSLPTVRLPVPVRATCNRELRGYRRD